MIWPPLQGLDPFMTGYASNGHSITTLSGVLELVVVMVYAGQEPFHNDLMKILWVGTNAWTIERNKSLRT